MLVPMTMPMNTAVSPEEPGRDIRRVLLIDGLLALAIAATSLAPFFVFTDAIVVDEAVETAEAVDAVVSGAPTETADAVEVWAAAVSVGPPTRWVLAVVLAIVLPLVVRRLWPRASFAVVLALTVLSTLPAVVQLTDGASTFLLGMNLPLLVSVFTVANLVGRRAAVATGGVGTAGVIAGAVLPYVVYDDGFPFFWADVLNAVAYAVMPVVLVVIVAQVLREQRLRADAAQRETAMAMVGAELRAASAASAERRRLASELHDIVAHHVNLMVVQAEKGPFVRDAEGTSRTYTTIAETGRAALGELDRLLGVLRTDGTGSTGARQMAPLPTIDEIPSLVDAANRAGVGVVLRTFEPPAVVEPAVAATVHRIVQECITNVVKHADHGEAATLSVTHAGSIITVRMENRSAGSERGARRGHGLDSMRSRLEVFGGSLSVDERDGTFRVEAIVPFTVPTRSGADRSAVTA